MQTTLLRGRKNQTKVQKTKVQKKVQTKIKKFKYKKVQNGGSLQ